MYLFIIQDRWNGARAGLCGQKLHKMNATLEKVGFFIRLDICSYVWSWIRLILVTTQYNHIKNIKMNATLEKVFFYQIGLTLDSLIFCDHPILSYKDECNSWKGELFIRSDICCELDSLIFGDCLIWYAVFV